MARGRFCNDVGEPATVVKSETQYLVWSLVPFDSPDAEDAKRYAAAIHESGNKYRALYDKHDFSQLDAEGRLRPRFEKAP